MTDAMTKHFSYRVLIQSLGNLYTKVSLIVLHKRIGNYHRNAPHKEHARDVKTPLMEFIESTVAQAVKPNNMQVDSRDSTIEARLQIPHAGHHKLSRERIDELSKYFKGRSDGADLHPPIREKLKHSVWEHLHAALRTARLGDKRNSKMHADIVDSACKELAHYMDKEPYLAFIADVESHLADLKPNQQEKDS